MMNGRLKLLDFDTYALVDPSENVYFVATLWLLSLVLSPENLREPFLVYTLVGESIIVQMVYWGCLISILHKSLPCDLVELEMFDFKLFLGWISCILHMPL